jgi:DNA-binding NarL/FixJ family response regulator
MYVGILTPVRLLGEGLVAALQSDGTMAVEVLATLEDLDALVRHENTLDAVIVDATQAIDLEHIRAFHAENPDLPLLALGLREFEREVVAHGRAGFAGYICRDDGLAELRHKLSDAIAGRFTCSPEMAAGIMRGLFRSGLGEAPHLDLTSLTPREEHVARLVARGLSNKEIGRHLVVSESTIKHHVHSILSKSGFSRRGEVVRSLRNDPWASGGSLPNEGADQVPGLEALR